MTTTEATIQAAIFDLDGVLMDTEWIAYQVWRDITATHGGRLGQEHFPAMAGLTAEETGEYIMQVSGVQFNLTASVALAWRQVTEHINAGIAPLPGAADLLQTLSARGLPLAIASNSPVSYIENALTGLGLRAYFQEIAGVDQVERGKPFPDLYLRAAELLGIAPERCLAVEDSYVGSQAALRAGMRVLAVPALADKREKFSSCYAIYQSLPHVIADLERVLQ